jgi:chemotaxis protein CheD
MLDDSVCESLVMPTVVFGWDTREQVTILPGEYHATRDDITLVTILGSCVAVCLHDRINGVAGMNHFLLPENPNPLIADQSAQLMRYGEPAMNALIYDMLKLGAEWQHLEAKVFGGASMLRSIPVAQRVGPRNAQFAIDYLQAHDIPVVRQSLGGQQARAVFFATESGQVTIRRSGQPVALGGTVV